MKVQGHRGSGGTHLDNTLSAFQEAIDAGADKIECDLRLTKDGHVVIYHDPFLEKRAPSDWTLPEIQTVVYQEAFDPAFPERLMGLQEKIVTLEEFFVFLQKEGNRNIQINLEMKKDEEGKSSSLELVKKTVDLVRRFQMDKRVYYSSFDLEILRLVKSEEPQSYISYILEAEDGKDFRLPDFQINSIAIQHEALTKERVKAFHAQGIEVAAWSVNDPERWQELQEMGVDDIITDYPRKLIAFLKKPTV